MVNHPQKGNLIKDWDRLWTEQAEINLPKGAQEWCDINFKIRVDYWNEIFHNFASGKKMLECGAGTAKVSFFMAQNGYECTMLDNSNIGLDRGRRAFQENAVSGNFVTGDVLNLPFKDKIFDVVYSGGLLEHFENVEPVVREMVRVLKPGGLFAADIIPRQRWLSTQGLVDNLAFCGRIFSRIINFRFNDIIKESQRKFPFFESPRTPGDYRRVMRSVGLANIVVTGFSPFPSIPFDKLRQVYVKVMQRMVPLWKRLDRSQSRLAEIFGNGYSAYGNKQ